MKACYNYEKQFLTVTEQMVGLIVESIGLVIGLVGHIDHIGLDRTVH